MNKDKIQIEKNLENSNSNINNLNNQNMESNSGSFLINAQTLEELMGAYKERGLENRDLQFISKLGGIEEILKKLRTSSKKGISSLEDRINDFGSNKVFIEPVPPFCSYVWESLEDLMVRILIVAALVQIILGATLGEDPSKDWIDGLSIIFAILVVTLVGSITNYQKENKFHELNDIQNEGTKYNVIRNGNNINLPSDDLLVGDLIHIMIGDIMPADLLLVEGNGIKMDESSLTGESETLKKEIYEKCILYKNDNNDKLIKVPSPLLLSGTNCVEGSGMAIVIAVGEHSQKGIIKRTVDNAQENSQTPLEEKLESIAEKIGYFGMFAGIVTLIALFIRFGVDYTKNNKEYNDESLLQSLMGFYIMNNNNKVNDKKIMSIVNMKLTNPKKNISRNILDIIMLCVSIIVVAIPEGLPLAVTLSLAFSIKKLMDKNNLVRKMHACETMGGANYICTDKTGTLTKNEMNVFKVLTANKEITLKETLDIENAGTLDNGNHETTQKKMREEHMVYFNNENFWEILKISIALNIDCNIKFLDKPNINGDMEECETKNKTDNAFIDFLYRFKSPISIERQKYINDKQLYKQMPFDSKKKKNDNLCHKFKLSNKISSFLKRRS